MIIKKRVLSVDAGAIILAGGKSKRMGTNKAFLKINGMTNIERMVNRLKPDFPDPILVTNNPKDYRFLDLKITTDLFPSKGPLVGVHAGLVTSSKEVNIIAACDMPFVTAKLATELVNHILDYDAVIPIIKGMKHPLFAVFKKNIVNILEDNIKNGQFRMKNLLEHLNVLYVTECDLSIDRTPERFFFNMNHPTEYHDAKKWAEAEL